MSRWLTSERAEDLAYALALRGRSEEAEVLERLGWPEPLTGEILELIGALAQFSREEKERLNALLPSSFVTVEGHAANAA